MAAIKAEGTKPERLLVEALHKAGVYPATNVRNLPGNPDIVFRRDKLVCFVDGELWHGGQWRRRGLVCLDEQFSGAKNREYWLRKVNANITRDIKNTAALLRQGWSVARFWASDIEKDPILHANRILEMRSRKERPDGFSHAATATVADFFAGIGLMRLALEQAGWQTVWANDYDPVKRTLYEHNLGSTVVDLDPRPIEAISADRIPRVGLISACFPCTDLSLAGAVRGIEEGQESCSFLRFATILSELKNKRPPFVILENVIGLIHSHAGKDFRTCVVRLADAGYRIDAVKVDAVHFVPQSRPRLFLIGVRDDIAIAPYSCADAFEDSALRPSNLAAIIRQNNDLPWAIRALPRPPKCERQIHEIIDQVDAEDSAWWSESRVHRLKEQVSTRHQTIMDSMIKEQGVVWATAFRRMRNGRSMAELRFDGIAGCLRTPKGGSAKQILIRADKRRWMARLINPTECGRLMGADDFRLDAEGIRPDDAYFGFGDAVCVPAVEWLVRNYINPLMAEILRGRLFAIE